MFSLLFDGVGDAEAAIADLRVTLVREYGSGDGVSVHLTHSLPFERVQDGLYECAKRGAQIAHRVLSGEGLIRGQLWVQFEVSACTNVVGRSAELLFALALIAHRWPGATNTDLLIAATGRLDEDGAVGSVGGLVAKFDAFRRAYATADRAVVFYPADASLPDARSEGASQLNPNIRFVPVRHVEDALRYLGIELEKTFLGNPFRGLHAFGYEHRAIYFGRDAEVEELIRALLAREQSGQPGALVIGASGSGKSSFIAAGVLPALVNPTRLRTIVLEGPAVLAGVQSMTWRPRDVSGTDESSVARSIWECWRHVPAVNVALGAREAPTALADVAEALSDAWPVTHRRVWVIDQFEELFTSEWPASVMAAFTACLAELQRQGVWVLASMRDDFLVRLSQDAALWQVFAPSNGIYRLPRLSGAAIDDVIAKPARAAGLEYERGSAFDRPLDTLLKEELPSSGEVLPLLQYALAELYDRRQGRVLTFEAYRAIGGIGGAVTHSAEEIVKGPPAVSSQTLSAALRRLVTVDANGQAVRRYAPMAEFAAEPAAFDFVQRLVQARLCTTDALAGETRVSVAHEALMHAWPRATAWLAEERVLLRERETVETEARAWEAHARARDWLATTPDRIAAQRRLIQADMPTSVLASDFVVKSGQLARRHRFVRRSAIAALVALAGLLGVASMVAMKQRDTSRSNLAIYFASKAWEKLEAHQLSSALRYALLAHQTGILPNDGMQALSARLVVDAPRGTALHVYFNSLSPDWRHALIDWHGSRLSVLDLTTGQKVPLPQAAATVEKAAFSPDGSRLVVALADGSARVWDAAKGTELLRLDSGGATRDVRFSPTGRHVLAFTEKHIGVLDGVSGKRVSDLLQQDVRDAAFTRDGSHVLAASPDRAVLWDPMTGEVVGSTSYSPATEATISPDGRRVLLTGGDSHEVWDSLSNSKVRVVPPGDQAFDREATFSSNGSHIVFRSGTSVVVWDVRSTHYSILETDEQVKSAAASADAAYVVTLDETGKARLWDVAGRMEVAHIIDAQLYAVGGFSADGRRVALLADSLSVDKVRVWDFMDTLKSTRVVADSDLVSAHFMPEGSTIVTKTTSGGFQLRNPDTGEVFGRIVHGSTAFVEVSPDGRSLMTHADIRSGAAASDADRVVRVWSARTGAETRRFEHAGPVYRAGWAGDGRRVATLSANVARLWNIDGDGVLTLEHEEEVGSLAFSKDGSRVLTGTETFAYLWDAATGRLITKVPGSGEPSFSPDGSRFIAKLGLRDAPSEIYAAADGRPIISLPHDTSVFRCQFSPAASRVACASTDDTVTLWDSVSGRRLVQIPHGGVPNTVEFSSTGKHLLSFGTDDVANVVKITSTDTGETRVIRTDLRRGVEGASFSPDGRKVLAWDDWSASVFDVDGEHAPVPMLGNDQDGPMRFSRDGRRVVRDSGVGAAVWDAATGRLLLRESRGTASELSPDGRRLLMVSAGRGFTLTDVSFVDMPASKLMPELCRSIAFEGEALSPDEIVTDAVVREGRRIATGLFCRPRAGGVRWGRTP